MNVVLAELFKTPFGIASAITILGVIVIAIFMFFWVKRKADSDKSKS